MTLRGLLLSWGCLSPRGGSSLFLKVGALGGVKIQFLWGTSGQRLHCWPVRLWLSLTLLIVATSARDQGSQVAGPRLGGALTLHSPRVAVTLEVNPARGFSWGHQGAAHILTVLLSTEKGMSRALVQVLQGQGHGKPPAFTKSENLTTSNFIIKRNANARVPGAVRLAEGQARDAAGPFPAH